VFALNIIRSSGLALIAAVVCALLWDTMGVRFVCRNSEQFKAAGTKLQAIQRGKTAPHEVNEAKKAYDLEAAKNAGSDEASSAKSALEKAKEREEAAKKHLEFLKKLKELTSEEQQKQAIDLCKEYLEKQHTNKAAAWKELAEHIEASQVEPGRLKAIQSTSKNTATVAIQSNSFMIRLLTMPPLNLWFAFRLAFIPGGVVYYHNMKTNETTWKKPKELKRREQAQTQIAKIQRGRMVRKKMKMKAATADDQNSNMKAPVANDGLTRLMEKVEADPKLVNITRAIAARVLTKEGGNVGKAFNRLTHNKGTHFNDITFAGAAKASVVVKNKLGSMKKLQSARNAWMEFTLEYRMGARSQLLRLWLTLRVVCIGVALLYLVVFLCMMLYVPSVDLYGPDPVEAGAIQNVIHSAVALAVALVFTPANRGRFVAWLGALGKSGMAATARKEAKKLRSRVDELRLKDTTGMLSQVEKSELSSSVKNLPQLESKVHKLEAEGKATAGTCGDADALRRVLDVAARVRSGNYEYSLTWVL
jgi:hypothetical protein